MLRKPQAKKNLDELMNQAKLVAKKKTDSEKIEEFPALVMDNIKLKRKIKDLESQLAEYRKANKQ